MRERPATDSDGVVLHDVPHSRSREADHLLRSVIPTSGSRTPGIQSDGHFISHLLTSPSCFLARWHHDPHHHMRETSQLHDGIYQHRRLADPARCRQFTFPLLSVLYSRITDASDIWSHWGHSPTLRTLPLVYRPIVYRFSLLHRTSIHCQSPILLLAPNIQALVVETDDTSEYY